ncbi:unnamed protein product [Bemisia tabaci]|uniref:Symplekin n=1 Tax=Bemisia tabaci TaxID=7038 RepID=A0A9P0G4K9_BEMTA|nr:PREDICTED: symplekin isoform X2 [Bemisia tabaci]CAH0768020.1 unnamed protein product [Bemisia tabaci]
MSTYSTIVEWLNEATTASSEYDKVEQLTKVRDLILRAEANQLDNFLDEMLAFQTDRSIEVRKFVVAFIEEACKKDKDIIPKIMINVLTLIHDPSVHVQKRVIQASSTIYRCALALIAESGQSNNDLQSLWNKLTNLKALIIDLVDSDNDGIRTHTVKFLETIILLQSYPDADAPKKPNDFSLEDIPLTLKVIRRRKLEEEANVVFDLLVKFHGSSHISSNNLMTCMGSLTNIAKSRPQYMGKVVAALETLHTNLPPTLFKTQVSSVRKHLKIQLLSLLKHPASVDFHGNITTLLTDLGATCNEVMKAYPSPEDLRKRMSMKRTQEIISNNGTGAPPKKMKIETTPVQEENSQPSTESTLDSMEAWILSRLTPQIAAELVAVSLTKLPEVMPPLFSATYTPIAAAGTPQQIKHVARLLATQISTAGLGTGQIELNKKQIQKIISEKPDEDEYEEGEERKIKTVITAKEEPASIPVPVPAPPPIKITKPLTHKPHRIMSLKLTEVVKPLSSYAQKDQMVKAVVRILESEKVARLGGVNKQRLKLITTLASTFNDTVKEAVLEYLLADLRSRIDIALSWLYTEYSFIQGFAKIPVVMEGRNVEQGYNHLICSLANSIIRNTDIKDKDSLMSKLYLEAPHLTEDAIDILKDFASREISGLNILQTLVLKRPPRQLLYLNTLLMITGHEVVEIRDKAISLILELFHKSDLRNIIEEYAVFYLGFLKLPQPPDVIFGADKGRPLSTETWTEEAAKVCLYLYLALVALNEELIHELAIVYVQTTADVKRVILRLLETPVKEMEMNSPSILKLVEECPKGAETLVTRVIHILTEKRPPSAELVERVRTLYNTRVSDIRFLIPVLNGLTKKEVIAALPKLIKLNPNVVKEVFNRLLGYNSDNSSSPLTPAELLIALHNIDSTKCELKVVIKATSLCMAERAVYTQEVLAIVMQNLMEMTPLPTLLMRTVIQSLSLYPKLIGFVMNVLQRLILKQVWRQKKVWEGFIKCCQRTKPQSFQVLLQLPAEQLADVFDASPDLRPALLEHIVTFTDMQRSHIPQPVMDILYGQNTQFTSFNAVKAEPMSPPDLTIDMES